MEQPTPHIPPPPEEDRPLYLDEEIPPIINDDTEEPFGEAPGTDQNDPLDDDW